ncbi:MAG: alpha/beta hydrolase family protein [Nitrospiraceae bacterium]
MCLRRSISTAAGAAWTLLLLLWLGYALQVEGGSAVLDTEGIAQWQAALNDAASPPRQPTSGPGGSDYSHASFTKTRINFGFFQGYFVYRPAQPRLANAPFMVYVHGAGQTEPKTYEPMFRHFARKGFLVVFPIYFLNAQAEVEAAYRDALSRFPAPPMVAFAGHSLGAMLGFQMAIRSVVDPTAVPRGPDVLVLHDPAGKLFFGPQLLQNASMLTASLLVVQAETSSSVPPDNNNSYALEVFTQTPAGLTKNFLRVRTDRYGTPDLISNHGGVASGPDAFGVNLPLNAIDWHGYWRPTEGGFREAFGTPFSGYSAFCRSATASCDPVRDMGLWSDGTPVVKIQNAGDLGL